MPLFVEPGLVVAIVARFTDRPPSSVGAHRLGWWLAGREPEEEPLWRLIGACEGTTERVIAGELVPDPIMAARIEEATRGYVSWRDWEVDFGAGWSARPIERIAA